MATPDLSKPLRLAANGWFSPIDCELVTREAGGHYPVVVKWPHSGGGGYNFHSFTSGGTPASGCDRRLENREVRETKYFGDRTLNTCDNPLDVSTETVFRGKFVNGRLTDISLASDKRSPETGRYWMTVGEDRSYRYDSYSRAYAEKLSSEQLVEVATVDGRVTDTRILSV